MWELGREILPVFNCRKSRGRKRDRRKIGAGMFDFWLELTELVHCREGAFFAAPTWQTIFPLASFLNIAVLETSHDYHLADANYTDIRIRSGLKNGWFAVLCGAKHKMHFETECAFMEKRVHFAEPWDFMNKVPVTDATVFFCRVLLLRIFPSSKVRTTQCNKEYSQVNTCTKPAAIWPFLWELWCHRSRADLCTAPTPNISG